MLQTEFFCIEIKISETFGKVKAEPELLDAQPLSVINVAPYCRY